MNGLLPLAAGIGVLLVGGIALARTAGGHASSRRLVEARLQELRLQDQFGAQPASQGATLSPDMPRWVAVLFARADFVPRIEQLIMGGAIVAAVAAIVFLLFGWLFALGTVVLAVAGAVLALWMIARRRIGRFVEDLPFFLDTVRQMLTTGNSVQQALARATDNAGANMQRYLLPMVRRMQNGASVAESAVWLAERLDVLELHMFATAIQTNIRYGGRLSQVLANLIAVLRDRSRVIRELQAATSETRMSALVLASLPIAAGGFIMFANPSYFHFFFATTPGNHMILIALFLEVAGSLVMRRLMRLDY